MINRSLNTVQTNTGGNHHWIKSSQMLILVTQLSFLSFKNQIVLKNLSPTCSVYYSFPLCSYCNFFWQEGLGNCLSTPKKASYSSELALSRWMHSESNTIHAAGQCSARTQIKRRICFNMIPQELLRHTVGQDMLAII